VNNPRSQKQSPISLGRKQQGAVLILIAFIIGLAVTAFLIRSLSTSSAQAKRAEDTMQSLKKAKEALIAWSVAHPNWPGIMPFPDRGNESSGDGYDGKSDCVTSGLNYPHLIGKLPLVGDSNCLNPQHGIGQVFRDSSGEVLWYAVSRNLIRTSSAATTPIINPGIINTSTDWLRVYDINGNLLSDKVAAVIMAPGSALANQSRSNTASPSNYLDEITIGSATYANWRFTSTDSSFVMGGSASSGTFNDRLIYITIDELITALEIRAANSAKEALNSYASTNGGNYPYAAPLGITRGYSCMESNNKGLLPLDNGSCSYSFVLNESNPPSWWPVWLPWLGVDEYAVSSICSFNNVEKVVFTRVSGANYTTPSQSCIANGLTCTCTGAGSCSGFNAPTFTCDGAGNCNSASHQRNENSRLEFEGGYFPAASGVCSSAPVCEAGKGYPVQCIGASSDASGTFTHDCLEVPLILPDWFRSNRWQDYFYYRTSRGETEDLASGDKSGLKAILIGAGAPLNPSDHGANQSRPSCVEEDYLDSDENIGGELLKFDPNYMPKTSTYNDKVFIVAP